MPNFEIAIKRPFSDAKKFAKGFLLYVMPFLNIITGIFATGYGLECARTAAKKKFSLPEWKNFGALFFDGLTAFVIGIIYALPAILSILAVILAGGASI